MERGKYQDYLCVLGWGALDAFDCWFVLSAGSSGARGW